jgi:hypothetical protein
MNSRFIHFSPGNIFYSRPLLLSLPYFEKGIERLAATTRLQKRQQLKDDPRHFIDEISAFVTMACPSLQ